MNKYFLATFCILIFATNLCMAQDGGQNLSPQEFYNATKNNNRIHLIDVRTPGEFNSGHIFDADNIDVSNRKFAIEIQELDRNTPTYIYCESGNRSKNAIDIMQEQGFTKIYNLDGGIKAWRDANIPTRNEGELSNLTLEEFKTLFDNEPKLLVDFTASWCGPCKILKPRIEALGNQVKIIYIDVDKNKTLADAFQIHSIPHLHFYKKGKLVQKSTGLISSSQLKRMIR